MESFTFKDLDNDGAIEFIVSLGSHHPDGGNSLDIFTWEGDHFEDVTLRDEQGVSIFGSLSSTIINDYDQDGQEEVIVYPSFTWKLTYNDQGQVIARDPIYGPYIKIYKLINGHFQLAEQLPFDSSDARGFAAVLPGEMPLSEILNVPDDNGKGGNSQGEAIKFFIGSLNFDKTVSDINTSTIKLWNKIPTTYVKTWENKHQDDNVYRPITIFRCSFNMKPLKNPQHFVVEPSDPAIPYRGSQYGLHFIGPYIEIKANKGDVLRKVKESLPDGANTTAMQVKIPFYGRLTNGGMFGGTAYLVIQPNWENRQAAKAEKARGSNAKPAAVKKPAPSRKPKP